MHYRLLTPPSPHSPLAQNIPLQSSFIQANAAAAAAAARAGIPGLPVSHSSLSMQRSTRSASPKNSTLMNGHSDERNPKKARIMHERDEIEERDRRDHAKETESPHDSRLTQASVSDRTRVTRSSPDVSTGTSERPNSFTQKDSPCGKDSPHVSPYKLVPRFKPDLTENVLEWSVEDVCHFVSSLTGSPEIAHAFREENIDGHSFLLIKEEHLLTRMAIRLGPALKINAQIKKLVESLELEESSCK